MLSSGTISVWENLSQHIYLQVLGKEEWEGGWDLKRRNTFRTDLEAVASSVYRQPWLFYT